MHVKQHQKCRDNSLRKHARQCNTTQQSCQSFSTQSTESSQLSLDSCSIRQQQHCTVSQPLHGPLLWHCCMPVLTNTAECAKTWFAPRLLPIYLLLALSFLHTSPSPPVLHDACTAPTLCTARPAFPPPFCSSVKHNLGPGVSVCVQIVYDRTHAHLLIN